MLGQDIHSKIYLLLFLVKVFKINPSNNSNAWQPFSVIFMFDIFLLHSHLYIVLFPVPNIFSSVKPGHGICIWAWTIRNLSHSFPSLPPWRRLCLFLLLRYLQGNHVYVKKWSVGKKMRDWKTIGGILAWENQEYPNPSYPSHLSSKWVPQGRHKYRGSGRIKQNATWVFVVVVLVFFREVIPIKK